MINRISSISFKNSIQKLPPFIRTGIPKDNRLPQRDIRREKLEAGYIPTDSDKWIPTGLSTIATMNYPD